MYINKHKVNIMNKKLRKHYNEKYKEIKNYFNKRNINKNSNLKRAKLFIDYYHSKIKTFNLESQDIAFTSSCIYIESNDRMDDVYNCFGIEFIDGNYVSFSVYSLKIPITNDSDFDYYIPRINKIKVDNDDDLKLIFDIIIMFIQTI